MKKLVGILGIALLAVLLLGSCRKPFRFTLDENIGVCGAVDRAAAAKAAGVSYLEAGVSAFLIPEKSEEEFAANRALAASSDPPIRTANGFYPADILLVGPDADLPRAVSYAETAIRRASEIGIEILVLGSSRSRTIPEGFARADAERQFVSLLKHIAPAAEKYGVTIAIEPLRPAETNFINSVREGAAIARQAESPAIRVLADLYHMAQVDEGPDALIDSADMLVHCHIAEKESRTPPGVAGDDFTPYFAALRQIRYTGRISIECGWSDFATQLPEAVRTMKEQIESVK